MAIILIFRKKTFKINHSKTDLQDKKIYTDSRSNISFGRSKSGIDYMWKKINKLKLVVIGQ